MARSFLTTPYGAYYQREVPAEDEELTHVGPGTPCGEYLRRFWQPVCYAEDLTDVPMAIRIMGEDLIVFRDGQGRVGLLQRHCSHRGTSLEFGLVSERGIRCCYHGWLYDVDGRILETPGEPPHSTLKDRLCQGAYPVHEFGGLIFAYLGPPDRRPPFPMLDTYVVPGLRLQRGQLRGVTNVKPCNWLQIQDNVVDLVHETFLHARASGYQFVNTAGQPLGEMAELGEYDFVESPIGILCAQTRRVKDDVWVRVLEYLCPNGVQIARPPTFPPDYDGDATELCLVSFLTRWRIPIDDTHTLELSFMRVPEGEESTYTSNPPPVVLSNYGIRTYEEQQRYPGDYEAQIGQRPIAIHDREHLGMTDRGVIMFRKMVREGIRAVQRGDDPPKGFFRDTRAIPTHANDTVLLRPPAPTPEEDRRLLRDAMREVMERALANSPVNRGGVLRI
jgi:phenylpropionate dioxygenase-like ring-hydroxylating dioxygenase large terminal subunit